MSKRARYTVRQVLEEVFADEDSDYDPEEEDIPANLSENVSETGENVSIDTSVENDTFLESNPQPSTSTRAEERRNVRGRGSSECIDILTRYPRFI